MITMFECYFYSSRAVETCDGIAGQLAQFARAHAISMILFAVTNVELPWATQPLLILDMEHCAQWFR